MSRSSGEIAGRHTGVLISNSDGEAAAYAIFNLQDRGPFFIGAQTRVYVGMIVGEHTRDNDLDVNVVRGKKLTNVRASGKDDAVLLTPPIKLTLETAMSYITDEELVEVTPQDDPPHGSAGWIRTSARSRSASESPIARPLRKY